MDAGYGFDPDEQVDDAVGAAAGHNTSRVKVKASGHGRLQAGNAGLRVAENKACVVLKGLLGQGRSAQWVFIAGELNDVA